jgi:hypothetical protein
MKRILVGIIALSSISAFAADVCFVQSGKQKEVQCLAKAICTDINLSIEIAEVFNNRDDDERVTEVCKLAEIKAIKSLVEINYEVKAFDAFQGTMLVRP